jgi:hypothetical protein
MRKLLGLWLLTLVAGAAPAWKEFRSTEGAFRGVFPGAPRVSHSQTSTPLGAVDTKVYASTSPKGSYAVAVTELPGAAVKFASDKVINDARAEILKDARAVELSWTEVNGGRELAYQSAQWRGWCQFFLVGNRLYVLDARMKPGLSRTAWVLPFFARFSPQL